MMGHLANLFLVASNFNFLERIFFLEKNHLKYTIFFKKITTTKDENSKSNKNSQKNFNVFFKI